MGDAKTAGSLVGGRALARGLWALFGLLSLCAWAPRAHAVPGRETRVLVLNSYHPQYRWTELLVRGALSELSGKIAYENVFIEYMDARRFVDDAEHLAALRALYAHKYARLRPDVILSSDDSALDFLLTYRDSLFPGVPIVFCGVNSHEAQELSRYPNMTGILEGLAIEENLQLIERLHPDARRIVLISDRTSLGAGMTAEANKAMAAHKGRAKLELWDDFTLPELIRKIETAPRDTVFLLLAIHQDKAGFYFAYEEHTHLLTDRARVPLYAMWGMVLGLGVTGGMMNDPYEHGADAARLALRVLDGRAPTSLPITTAVYRPRFDFAQLQKLGIDPSRLPRDAEIQNRPFSFYDSYRSLVWGSVLVASLMALAITGLLLIIRRMQSAERALRESQAELRNVQRMEAVGRLAAGIAHDFNNLLVPILGCSELLMSRVPAGDGAMRELMAIHQSGERARLLVQHLLAYGRTQRLVRTPLSLGDVLAPLTPVLQRLVGSDIELEVRLGENVPIVLADRTQVERVIVNLVSNANDAVRESQRVPKRILLSTHVERLDEARAKKLRMKAGRYACLTVEDNGVGMASDVQERIFEPFFSTKRRHGTGLGLASVHGIVEQHEGAILVDSELARGSRFEVLLPETDQRTVQKALPAALSAALEPCCVLLVEDDTLARAVLEEMLVSAGHTVLCAKNGVDALARFDRNEASIDVVLTDISMPQMTGIELRARLKQRAPHVPVLFMTGYDRPEPGLSDDGIVLRKPFTTHELHAALARVLRHHMSGTSSV